MAGGENLPIEISSDSSDHENVNLIDWDVILTRHKASGSQALVVTALYQNGSFMVTKYMIIYAFLYSIRTNSS